MPPLSKLIGRRFGRLIVNSQHFIKGAKNAMWNCTCDCGRTTIVQGCSLKNNKSQSCGCLLSDIASKTGSLRASHGHKRKGSISPTYVSWQGMNSRCNTSSNPAYPFYAERGITICERWKKFENFLDDMGERPIGLTLERKDNSKGYYPDNCKWATYKEQANNRSSRITFTWR